MLGDPPASNAFEAITFIALKDFLEKRKAAQEASFVREITEAATPPPPLPIEDKPVAPEAPLVTNDESGIHNAENYGLPLFPGMTAFLFWFQKKAVKAMLDNALGFDVSVCKDVIELKKHWHKLGKPRGKRGQLLLASTGTGKTFMAAAFVKYLVFIGYTEDCTFGPIEYLYITRASIVTQTKRVFDKQFGLSVKDSVEILNVEQLRSKAGQLWVNEKQMIIQGEEVTVWEWRNGMQPVVMLLDESQAFKNESTQSAIIHSYAEIKTNLTHTVSISATPFTRVSEAKSFVLNCHLNDTNLI
jgi:hypothetical protein